VAVEIRHITADEMREFYELVSYVFATSREDHEAILANLMSDDPWFKREWAIAAVVDGTVASTLGAYPWDVRVNGRPVPSAGVTEVGTRPDYRRRGYQRQVMTHALRWHHECGQAFAMLWASFGAIYQRYGYGLASAHTSYTFNPEMAVLRDPVPTGHTVRMVDWQDTQVRATVERVYAEYAKPRNLAIDRPDWWWRTEKWRWGYERKQEKRIFQAIASDASGRPRGYIAYRASEQDLPYEPGPNQTFEVEEFIALDLDAWRALWNYILAHDLVKTVEFGWASEDDPATDLLLEPRALRRRTGDGMWLRIVDVAPAIEGRGYEPDAEGSVVIGMRDDLCPWNDGAYRVTVEGGQATVKPVKAKPQLTMPIAALSSLYSGFRSATALARAGRVEGSPRALRTADRLFTTAYRPHVLDGF